MLCLSQTTGYAVRALGCLHKPDSRVQLIRDIAKCAGIPKPYLAQIFNKLNHTGLVVAKRGYYGGIALARPAEKISVLEIVEAVEGENWIAPCLLNMEECAVHCACPAHKTWLRLSRQLRSALKRTSLAAVMAVRKGMKSTRRRQGCP